jgi:hypothetical protein
MADQDLLLIGPPEEGAGAPAEISARSRDLVVPTAGR